MTISTASATGTVRHVIGPAWRGDVPVLRVWVPGTEVQEMLALEGELCLTPLPERRCTGRVDHERSERVPCPRGEMVARASAQCDRCRIEEGTYLCLACDGTHCPVLPPALEARCRRPHRLYLMDFGSGPVKVGTSAAERGAGRIVEQGPLAAAFIALGNGPAIKRLEKVAATLGTTERVTRRRKGGVAFRDADRVVARERVQDAYQSLSARITGDDAAALHAPDFVDLPAPDRPQRSTALHRIAVRPGTTIRGPVLEVRGGFALIAVLGVPAVLDLAELRGYYVDLALAEPAPPPPLQMSLLIE